MKLGVSGVIPRVRLHRRLESAGAHPITLVAAPAGCGKSVALRDYLDTLSAKHVLFEVRPGHETLSGFLRAFAAVVDPMSPGTQSAASDALRSAAGGEAAAILASWLAERLAAWSGVIAIDDLHIAADDARTMQMLNLLIELTKVRIRWILASRTLQHLPISSWVVYGDAAIPIEEDDLRFTAGEAMEAASQIGFPLEPTDVEHLMEATGGWATALNLALRAAEFSPDVQSALGAARKLSYQFLAEHVYGSLTPDEQSLLLFGSVLPAFDVAVLERAGFEHARSVLHGIRERITLLSVAANAPNSYRCHDLFRDFLEHQLELRGEAASAAVRLQAAHALAACGQIVPALGLYAKTRAGQEILQLLEQHGFDLTQQGSGDDVRGALDALAPIHNDDPLVLALRAQLEITAGHMQDATSLLERAHAACTQPRLRSTIALRLALVRFNADDARTIALIESALAEPDLPPSVRGELLSLLCAARGKRGLFDGLRPLLDEAEQHAIGVQSDITRMLMLQRIGLASYYCGDTTRCERVCSRAAGIAAHHGIHRVEVFALQTISAMRHMNEDGLPAALEAAEKAVAAAERIQGQPFFLRVARAHRMHVLAWSGGEAELVRELDSYTALPGNEDLDTTMTVQFARAMLASWNGRFALAAQLLGEKHFDGVFIESRIIGKAWCALFLALSNDGEAALSALQDSMDAMRKARSPRPSLRRYGDLSRALWALTQALCGRCAAAERLLARKPLSRSPVAAALCSAASIIVSRLDIGVRRTDLAEPFAVLNQYGQGGFVRTFEALVSHTAPKSEGDAVLTPAELGVLRALASGKTPKEIAFANGCSINTVRWHTRQAIAKFGCSGREQAILAARARGLL